MGIINDGSNVHEVSGATMEHWCSHTVGRHAVDRAIIKKLAHKLLSAEAIAADVQGDVVDSDKALSIVCHRLYALEVAKLVEHKPDKALGPAVRKWSLTAKGAAAHANIEQGLPVDAGIINEAVVNSLNAPPSTVVVLGEVLAERVRKIEGGHDADSDDTCTDGELAKAAVFFALPEFSKLREHNPWPFKRAPNTSGARRMSLIKAAAFLVAEIERIDRASPPRGFVAGR